MSELDPSIARSPVTPANSPVRPLNLGARDAAKILAISPRLLWTMTNSGAIPHVRIGRRILYPLAALHAWLDARTKGTRRV